MPPPLNIITPSDIDVLARTIWGEARGESEVGQEAVACVVINRWQDRRRWQESVAEVSLELLQFSAWNSNNPGRTAMASVGLDEPSFLVAYAIAADACAGRLEDPTRGANHYVNPGVVGWDDPNAWWVKADRDRAPSVTIGNHRFWRL